MSDLDGAYLACFRRYLEDPGEPNLGAAYDLGRDAVRRGATVMEVAIAHHEALVMVLAAAGDTAGAQGIAWRAGEFFLESLAAFDMVQRGYHETRDLARAERRHAEMLRLLSSFLADASLALEGPRALDEVLCLVAEQARELVGVQACLVSLGVGPQVHSRAASHVEDDRRWPAFVRWVDLRAVESLVHAQAGHTVRLDAAAIERHLPRSSAGPTGGPPVSVWLGVALEGLDGRVLGCLHLLSGDTHGLGPVDQAVAVHLARMSAAAVERVELYHRLRHYEEIAEGKAP